MSDPEALLRQISEEAQRLQALETQCREARDRVQRLRDELETAAHRNGPAPTCTGTTPPDASDPRSPEQKVTLYRSLFRGRPDVTGIQLGADVLDVGIQGVYRALAADAARNQLILDEVISAVRDGRSPIVLTERRDHLEFLEERLRGFVRHTVVLKGGMTSKERAAVVARLATIPDDEERLVLATGRYIGEGFDDARLDTLFLALPVSWEGTLAQYTGRLHRLHPAKTEVRIVDFVDGNVPLLAAMYQKRFRAYRALGYTSAEPLSGAEPEYPEPGERYIEYKRDEQEPDEC